MTPSHKVASDEGHNLAHHRTPRGRQCIAANYSCLCRFRVRSGCYRQRNATGQRLTPTYAIKKGTRYRVVQSFLLTGKFTGKLEKFCSEGRILPPNAQTIQSFASKYPVHCNREFSRENRQLLDGNRKAVPELTRDPFQAIYVSEMPDCRIQL
jgi:hypothetical protein